MRQVLDQTIGVKVKYEAIIQSLLDNPATHRSALTAIVDYDGTKRSG